MGITPQCSPLNGGGTFSTIIPHQLVILAILEKGCMRVARPVVAILNPDTASKLTSGTLLRNVVSDYSCFLSCRYTVFF